MAPLLLPVPSHCASIVAGATHRCSTLSDLDQGPPLQGVAGGVVAGLYGHGRSVEAARPHRVGDGANNRESIARVVIGCAADRYRGVPNVDVPRRLRSHREHVRVLVQRPEVATDECRALFAAAWAASRRELAPGSPHRVGHPAGVAPAISVSSRSPTTSGV